MTPENVLVWIVVAYAAITFFLVAPFFVWAVRNGQFRSQDRARYLALDTRPPAGQAEVHKDGL